MWRAAEQIGIDQIRVYTWVISGVPVRAVFLFCRRSKKVVQSSATATPQAANRGGIIAGLVSAAALYVSQSSGSRPIKVRLFEQKDVASCGAT